MRGKTIRMSLANKLLLFSYLYYLAIFLMPIVQSYISVYVQISSVMLILLIILFYRNIGKMLIFIYPFSLLLILQSMNGIINEISGVYEFFLYHYSLLISYIHVFVSFYFLNSNNKKAIKVIIILTFVFTIITTITSIIGLQRELMAARMIATPRTSQEILLSFRRMNIGGFGFVYTCVLFVPIIIASYKHKKIKLWQFTMLIVPISYYVLLTQYATALIILVLAFFSFFLPTKATYKKTILIAVVGIIFFLLLKPLFAQLLYTIANNTESYMLRVKISTAADVIAGVENYTESLVVRQEVYKMSVDAFLEHPFTGTFLYNGFSGRHSFILDTLALFGIFGLLALVLVYKQIYQYFYRPFKNTPYYGYMMWSLALSILLAFLNPIGSMFSIGLFIPLFTYGLQGAEYEVKLGKRKL